MSETSTQRFLASLQRCETSADFLPRFYRRFMDTSEEVREKTPSGATRCATPGAW